MISRLQDSEVSFLQAGGLKAAHGFFGRRGGVSAGIFAGLNCGPGSGDNPEHVKTNREIVVRALGGGELLSLHQIHSAECVPVKEPWAERPKADALVTDVPGLVLSVLTADCAPVLFEGSVGGKPVIGAAHAGWGGALGGVLEATVERMLEYGAELESIRAAVGPCIQKKSYEVGQEFYDRFIKHNPESERFFQESRKAGHCMFDLPGYCAARLQERGVGQVELMDVDTYAREADYYSFRRATHRGEKDYGRQISAIVINP
ncbi:MAG: peptidoglycan editing factor PgeF [Alphaproteobacteria bacterium]|nr:peptidoglycan editing factor PgeF [Alphaproteobacteria bacterium]